MAARQLARSGARVALVDGSHPREKACGGGVTGRALAQLGGLEQFPTLEFSDVRTLQFEAGDRAITMSLPARYLDVFTREAFDAALRQAAISDGAVPVTTRAGGIARGRGSWTVTTAEGGTLCSSWLLGADGAGGITRKHVFRPFERSQLSIAAGSYVDAPAISEIVIRFVDEPRGYLWSFPRPGHLAVGTCAQADASSTARMHAVTDAWLDRYPPAQGRPRRRYAWPIPSLGVGDLDAEQPAGDGWLLLGDAAGLVDPITREGIFFAIYSGIVAAQALASGDPARHYGAAVRDEMHDELRRAARLKAGFFRPRFTSLLITALERSAAIREVMTDLVAGRQPYRGLERRLLATLELGLAWRLLRTR